ncbi:hypothetical protein AO498_10282 [Algoriphagus sanaruensis]|uniref:Uncharacterized protein n=1 Tax=Algoriphagus sanaruensis TaxID=1727163 RepID=A0A142ENW1_9BACT|nr:hypothetical protein AO498_10282 [Algoriphagus sanaruensis]
MTILIQIYFLVKDFRVTFVTHREDLSRIKLKKGQIVPFILFRLNHNLYPFPTGEVREWYNTPRYLSP